MSALVLTTSLCPACRMVLHLRTPIIVLEDGSTAIDRSDIERAVHLHLRLACSEVARSYATPERVDEDEDEGVP